ncbi:acetate--CoA ligase family protein [Candidatus Woesearchaeota archaeon]|nr:acetate--CoA ligase family protein [Candidatus Woesearchaeota archaeon]
MLDINKTRQMLGRHNLLFCKSRFARNLEEAVKAAESIGWPVVLKIVSPDIIHKSDFGGVAVELRNKEQLLDAYNKMMKIKRKAKITGVLVQKMCSGHEIIIGAKYDEQFGPVVMFGLGGIFVEVLDDVSFRIAPVNRKEAENMVKEIKGYALLAGARGQKKANIKSIVSMITKVSKMIMANKRIAEIDFNPVIVNEKKAVIADARIIIK